MTRTRIKICGVRTPEIALACVEAGADAIGLVFARSSPRFIEPEMAWEISSYLPPLVTRVGLFVDPAPVDLERLDEPAPFDLIQLHGSENESLVRELGPWVIKAVQFDERTIEAELTRWNQVEQVHAILVDGSPGGRGQALDWSSLARVFRQCAHPLILAGGLTPDNVGEAIRVVRPFAVDVSSGVERERGVKDPQLIAEFCRSVQRADASGGS